MLNEIFNVENVEGSVAFWRKGSSAVGTSPNRAQAMANGLKGQIDFYFHVCTHDLSDVQKGSRGTIKTARTLTCLWADIDLAEKDPDRYPTKDQVKTALEQLGLPPSIVVNSGQGWHMYWLLDEVLPAKQFASLPKQWIKCIKKVVQRVGGGHLEVDQTGDLARVLRVPGTIHQSTGLPVEVMSIDPKIRYIRDQFQEVIAREEIQPEKRPTVAAKDSSMMRAMGMIYKETDPPPLPPILKSCPQMLRAAQYPEKINEVMWYNVLGVVGYSKNADKNALTISKGHPNYDPDETISKMRQWVAAAGGPATCERFADLEPNICKKCPHYKHITSPIQLGHSNQKLVVDVEPKLVESSAILPDDLDDQIINIPIPYRYNDRQQLVVDIKMEETGEREVIVIYDHPLYPTRRLWDERNNSELVYFKSFLPNDGWREYPIPVELVNDTKYLLKEFSKQGVVVQPVAVRYFTTFIVNTIKALQRKVKAGTAYSRMGWREDSSGLDKFVLGTNVYYPDGTKTQEEVSPALSRTAAQINTHGTLDAWVNAFDKLNNKQFIQHQFASFTAFAAPLLSYTDFPGFIYNLYSPASGTFKSFLLKVITSVYGPPTEKLILERDTENAKYKILSSRCDLPVVYDEMTNIDPVKLSNLCYSVSQGRGHHRLEQDSSLRDNLDEWRTIMVSTSNASLNDTLFINKANAAAEAYRVIEVNVSSKYPPISKDQAMNIMREFKGNYGHAGEKWVQYISANQMSVRSSVEEIIQFIDNKTDATSAERFWTTAVGTIVASIVLTKKLGLHNFDPNLLTSYGIALINNMRQVMDHKVQHAIEVLQDFILNNIDAMVISNGTEGVSTPIPLQNARNQLLMRLDQAEQILYVRTSEFKKHCVKQRIDMRDMEDQLSEQHLLIGKGRKRLGVGSSSGYTNVGCLFIDVNAVEVVNLAVQRESALVQSDRESQTESKEAASA